MGKKEPPPSEIKQFTFHKPPKKKKKKKVSEEGEKEQSPEPKVEEEDEEWLKEKQRREESLKRAQLWDEKKKAEKLAKRRQKAGLEPNPPAGRGRGRGRKPPPSAGGKRRVRRVGAMGRKPLDQIPEDGEASAPKLAYKAGKDEKKQGAWVHNEFETKENRPVTKQSLRPPTSGSTRPITSQSNRPVTSQSQKRPPTTQSKRAPSRVSQRPETSQSKRPPTTQSTRPETKEKSRPVTVLSQRPQTAVKENNEEKQVEKQEEKVSPQESNVEKKEDPKDDDKKQEDTKQEGETQEDKKEEENEEVAAAVVEEPKPNPTRKLSVLAKVSMFSKTLFKRAKANRQKEENEESKIEEEPKEGEEEKKDLEEPAQDENAELKTEETTEEKKEESEELVKEDDEKTAEQPEIPSTEEVGEAKEEAVGKEEAKEEVVGKEDAKEEEKEDERSIPAIVESAVEEPPKVEEKVEEKIEETEEQEEKVKEEESKQNKGFFGLFKKNVEPNKSMTSLNKSTVSLLGKSRISLQPPRPPSVVSKHSVACSPIVFEENTAVVAQTEANPADAGSNDVSPRSQQKKKTGWGRMKTLFSIDNKDASKAPKNPPMASQIDLQEENTPVKESIPVKVENPQQEVNATKDEVSTKEDAKPKEVAHAEKGEDDVKTAQAQPEKPVIAKQSKDEEDSTSSNRPVIIINASPGDSSFQQTLIQALQGKVPSNVHSGQDTTASPQMPMQMQMPVNMGMPMYNPYMMPNMPFMGQGIYPYGNMMPGYPQMMPPNMQGQVMNMQQFPNQNQYMAPPVPREPPRYFESMTREQPDAINRVQVTAAPRKTVDRKNNNEATGTFTNTLVKTSANTVRKRVAKKLAEADEEVADMSFSDEYFEDSDTDDEFYKQHKRKNRRGRRRDMLYQQQKALDKKEKDDQRKEEERLEQEKENERQQFASNMKSLLNMIDTGEELVEEVKPKESEDKQEGDAATKLPDTPQVPDMDLESFLKKDEEEERRRQEGDEFSKMLAALNAEAEGVKPKETKDAKDNGPRQSAKDKQNFKEDQNAKPQNVKKKSKLDDVMSSLMTSLNTKPGSNTTQAEDGKGDAKTPGGKNEVDGGRRSKVIESPKEGTPQKDVDNGTEIKDNKKTLPQNAKNKGKLDDILSNLMSSLNTKPGAKKAQLNGSEEDGVSGVEKSENERMEKEENNNALFVKQEDVTKNQYLEPNVSHSIHVSPIASREPSGDSLHNGIPPSQQSPMNLGDGVAPGGMMVPGGVVFPGGVLVPSVNGTPQGGRGSIGSINVGGGRKMTPEQLLHEAQVKLLEARKALSPSNSKS